MTILLLLDNSAQTSTNSFRVKCYLPTLHSLSIATVKVITGTRKKLNYQILSSKTEKVPVPQALQHKCQSELD